MTTINTSEDLLRLLREDAHFYEQARRLILTDELITLPERFAAFAARIDDFVVNQERFNDEQRQFNQRVDGFITQQEEFNQRAEARFDHIDARFERIDARFDRMDARFDRMDARFDRMDARFDRMEGDFSYFKNRFSESQVAEEAATIAMAMGFTLERVLSNADLAQMCQHPNAESLLQGDLISFTRADLALEVSDQAGKHHLIAVEISYTADRRDTDRAVRNADYLTRFTGQPGHAAVASARNDQEIQGLIDEGLILWYALEDHTDGTESR